MNIRIIHFFKSAVNAKHKNVFQRNLYCYVHILIEFVPTIIEFKFTVNSTTKYPWVNVKYLSIFNLRHYNKSDDTTNYHVWIDIEQ